MKKFVIFILLNIFFLYGCSQPNKPTESAKIGIDELIKSPTNLKIDTTQLLLNTYLWRDFMPISPPNGHPMSAIINVITSDSSDFPDNLDADKIWVIDSINVWETGLADNFNLDSIFQISRQASDGPKWNPGIFVDVVVRLVHNDSIYYYLKAEDVEIFRTD